MGVAVRSGFMDEKKTDASYVYQTVYFSKKRNMQQVDDPSKRHTFLPLCNIFLLSSLSIS